MEAEVQGTDRDLEEFLQLMSSGRKDEEVLARARARADEICKQMGAKYGHRKIAVDLVREARDEQ